jgi:hypothetical protein
MVAPNPSCAFCTNLLPLSVESCPHCGQPSLFPNVAAASDPAEVQQLEYRYKSACDSARIRNCEQSVIEFEQGIASAELVMCRPLSCVEALASTDNEVLITYENRVKSGITIPRGDKWDGLRAVAAAVFFRWDSSKVHFAALSLSGYGLDGTFGECSIILRPIMVSHRTSFFQENSALFVQYSRNQLSDIYEVPKGYRSAWQDRGRLCVAKLAILITETTPRTEYPSLLIAVNTRGEDDCVEGHVWGSLTVRSVEAIRIRKWSKARRPRMSELRALRERLTAFGVTLETP